VADEVLMGYLKYYFMYLKEAITKGKLIHFFSEALGSFVNHTALHFIPERSKKGTRKLHHT